MSEKLARIGGVPPKQRRCVCTTSTTSCPAARRISFFLQPLKRSRREGLRKKLRKRAPDDLLLLLRCVYWDRCQYCGGLADDPTVDRIVPQAMGGDYSARNVTLACRRCNSRKCDRDFVGPVRSFADAWGELL